MIKTLTSIQIDMVDTMDSEVVTSKDEQLFYCKVYGKTNSTTEDPAIEFEVNLTESEVEYSPVHIRTDIHSQLPEYMAEDIAFETKEAPVFMSLLLKHTIS